MTPCQYISNCHHEWSNIRASLPYPYNQSAWCSLTFITRLIPLLFLGYSSLPFLASQLEFKSVLCAFVFSGGLFPIGLYFYNTTLKASFITLCSACQTLSDIKNLKKNKKIKKNPTSSKRVHAGKVPIQDWDNGTLYNEKSPSPYNELCTGPVLVWK